MKRTALAEWILKTAADHSDTEWCDAPCLPQSCPLPDRQKAHSGCMQWFCNYLHYCSATDIWGSTVMGGPLFWLYKRKSTFTPFQEQARKISLVTRDRFKRSAMDCRKCIVKIESVYYARSLCVFCMLRILQSKSLIPSPDLPSIFRVRIFYLILFCSTHIFKPSIAILIFSCFSWIASFSWDCVFLMVLLTDSRAFDKLWYNH